MANINGATTYDQLTTELQLVSIDKSIHRISQAATLTHIVKNGAMKKNMAKINSPKREWFEKGLLNRVITANGLVAAATSGTITATTAANAALLREGDLLINESDTDQSCVVVSVSGTTINWVTRDGVVTFECADGAKLLRYSNTVKDADTPGSARAQNETEVYNYAQMFETTVDVGLGGMQDEAGNVLKRRRFEAAEEHVLDIEYAFWFGEKYQDTTNKRWFTEGIYQSINDGGKILDLATAHSSKITMNAIPEIAEMAHEHSNGRELLMFVSPAAMTYLDQLVINKVQLENVQKFGVWWKRLCTSHGDFLVRKHPLFKNSDTTETTIGNMFVIVDPRYIDAYCVNGFSDSYLIKEYANLKTGYRGVKDFYFTWAGIRLMMAERHMIVKSVEGYA